MVPRVFHSWWVFIMRRARRFESDGRDATRKGFQTSTASPRTRCALRVAVDRAIGRLIGRETAKWRLAGANPAVWIPQVRSQTTKKDHELYDKNNH